MRQSSTETLRSFFGETGVAAIGQMEANLPELAKLGDWHQVEAHMKSFLHSGDNRRIIRGAATPDSLLRFPRCVLRPKIREFGATLIAISPEKPDHGIVATEKNKLTFPVLSDFGNKVARLGDIVDCPPANWKWP